MLRSQVATPEQVGLHPLTFLPEGDDVVVGRTDTDSYAVFPPDGAALIEQLLRGTPPEEAARWYEQTYGEQVDLQDFLATLAELDFLDPGGPSAPQAANSAPDRLRWQATGRAVFSPAAWVGYAAVVALAALACVRHPDLVPHRDHVFFSRYLLAIELTVAFGQIPLILVHEAFHVLAARRLGLRARVRISHRLYFVVFETVMDGLVIVPRRQRYLPMLAGLLADLLLVSLLTLGAWAGGGVQGGSLVSGVCLALAFTTVLRMAMEFLLFLRTDVYFLVCTVCGCVDLHTTSREMVLNRLWRSLGRTTRLEDPGRWHPNDVRAARWYAPLYVLGYGVALALLALVLVPISWRFLETAVTTVARPDVASGHFWDATGLLLLNVAQPAAAGLLRLRDRVQSRRSDSARSQRIHEVNP